MNDKILDKKAEINNLENIITDKIVIENEHRKFKLIHPDTKEETMVIGDCYEYVNSKLVIKRFGVKGVTYTTAIVPDCYLLFEVL